MSNVKNALTRKIGPFPAWVWAIGIGAILYVYRRRAGASTQDQANLASVGPYGQDYYPIQGGAGIASGDTGSGGGASGTDTGSNNQTPGPPSITVNAPPADQANTGGGGKPRTQKAHKKHTQKKGPKTWAGTRHVRGDKQVTLKKKTRSTSSVSKPRNKATTQGNRRQLSKTAAQHPSNKVQGGATFQKYGSTVSRTRPPAVARQAPRAPQPVPARQPTSPRPAVKHPAAPPPRRHR